MADLVERLRAMAGSIMVPMENAMNLLLEAANAIEAAQEDAVRLDWLSQLDVGICHLGYGDYQWYSYANPKPEHGMLGLRAAIDKARGKGEESNESMDH